ncbi:Alpha/Beta hydrolase protein [Ilyonectria destructans]|nr:Alpha/Beta hydrolase protein [Ilyonectria destructans]
MSFLLRHFFPRNGSFGFEALRAACYSNYGGADLGEVIAICSRIPSGDEESWLREWRAAADRAAAGAQESLSVGNTISAREAFLRASNYYRTAEFYRRENPTDDGVAAALSDSCTKMFISAVNLMPYTFEEIKIPYEKATLPGFLMCPQGVSAPRPTIIFNGGFDSVMEEAWFAIAAPALERGFNVLAFDGPGQGQALRQQGLVFRPDWECVITPVMDYALDRPEIKPDKVVLFGWSMGGYLIARASTREHRAAAVILDDGVYDFGSAFHRELPPLAAYMLHQNWNFPINLLAKVMSYLSTGSKWGMGNARWAFGVDTMSEVLRKVKDYTLVGRVEDIATPTLVLNAPDDHFLKGQPQKLFDKLKCEKSFVEITRHEGGSMHCHMGTFSRLHQVIFDYLSPRMHDDH